MKIRTLIVDDERLARGRLAQLLAAEPDMEVVGECASGREAVAAIRDQVPDLVFLDIQMPELDGFGVLQELRGGKVPAIVFVTAFDKFAVKAFEVHALDYLLKPFDKARFHVALEHARQQLTRQRGEDLSGRLAALAEQVQAMKAGKAGEERIAVKHDGRLVLLRVADIDWVEAADNYVALHVGTETRLVRETMANMEARLPQGLFVRISRSAMVNTARVKELEPLFHGDYSLVLRDGTRLTLTRTHRESALRALGREV
jgi:two-component system, LytTR family, response regulator